MNPTKRRARRLDSGLGPSLSVFLVLAAGFGCAHANTIGSGGSGGASGGASNASTAGATTGFGGATGSPASTTVTNGVTSVATTTDTTNATAAQSTTVTTATGPVCGDGICDPSESCTSCPSDCPTCPTTVSSSVTTGVGGGACHDPCTVGPAMDPNACAAQPYGACVADVCTSDSFCCTTMWDDTCTSDVDNSFVCIIGGYFC